MSAFAADKFGTDSGSSDMCLTDFVVGKTDRNGNLFKVHADEGIADINSGIGLDFFQGDRMLKGLVSGGCKGTAGFGLGNNIDELHVMTPCIGTVNLYKTSGHWDHYRENMFPAMEMEGESYVLRPMNCPHHMMIYANQPHSYRQLPIRIGEIAHDFRYESSGTLKGIERGRHFCQNDAHLFCTPEQIKSEVADVCALIFDVYKDFNITDYRCVLSLRDPADKKKYHDDDAMWNHAENALREVLTELGIHFTEEIGEAAFYGPKLDVNVKPAVGAEYTLSTCQLDFCLPAKFHLTYVDKDGTEKTPVVLHRAILGSLDRFTSFFATLAK